MEKLFELPELFTLSGKKVTGEMSFEDLAFAASPQTCAAGSGTGND